MTFNVAHSLSPDRMFGNAAVVMLPKMASDESIPGPVEELYGETLRTKFHLVAESSDWKLYKRS